VRKRSESKGVVFVSKGDPIRDEYISYEWITAHCKDLSARHLELCSGTQLFIKLAHTCNLPLPRSAVPHQLPHHITIL